MEPVVTVAQGQLRGREKDGVVSFLGVPYARPPFGELRFAAPAPVQSWAGIRDAIDFGPTAPQPGYQPPTDVLLPNPIIAGRDCLNLNIWAPEQATGLPVLVWIHGGAFANGSNAVPTYDGSTFARDGIVCVSLNYRLGVDGYGSMAGAPDNRGVLDQIAALTWVQENIAVFGGDPGCVTVAGESAGAMSIGTLLAVPAARGLFRRAILQSGAGHHVLTAATAAKVTAEIGRQLGVDPTVAGLGSVQVDDLVRVAQAVQNGITAAPDPVRWGEITRNAMAFEPVIDGNLLPARPIDAIAGGAGADVDVLIGTNSDEHALFLVPTGFAAIVTEDLLRMALGMLGVAVDDLIDTYRGDLPNATPGELMIDIFTDWFFRIPAVRVAEARSALGEQTYAYEFGWRSPQFGGQLGAAHALELPFVFDDVADRQNEPMAGPNPPQSLADAMHGAWVAFVRDGDPGWPAYGDGRQVMRFAETTGLVLDPRSAQRELWTGVR